MNEKVEAASLEKLDDTYRCESCGRWVFWIVTLPGKFGPDRWCVPCYRAKMKKQNWKPHPVEVEVEE